MADNRGNILNLTNILTAVFALAGGALSGGLATYAQLKASHDKFSIDRANMFRQLTSELRSDEDKTARMALLNLWQLYPDERDQKIIITAAFETGQPDLVETMLGFDEELRPFGDMLYARALSSDPQVGEPAMRALVRIDPKRATRLMVSKLDDDIRVNGDRHVSNDTVIELTQLIQTREDAAEVVRSQVDDMSRVPLLFEYILYNAGKDSEFVDRILKSYRDKDHLILSNDFLANADFRETDAARVVEEIVDFVLTELQANQIDPFDLTGTLVGLRNNSLTAQLHKISAEPLVSSLRNAVVNDQIDDNVREKALALLRGLSPRETLEAIAEVLKAGSAGRFMKLEIRDELDSGLVNSVQNEQQKLVSLEGCGPSPSSCIDDAQVWIRLLGELTGR